MQNLMALRSALNKMPTLGRRSLPIGRRISPAAGSGHPTNDQLKTLWSWTNRLFSGGNESNERRVKQEPCELHNNLAELDKIIGNMDQDTADMVLSEIMR